LSFVAFFMSTVVQSVVAFELTSRNGAVGSVIFAQGLAMMALGPFGGAVADRLPKRSVLLVCQSAIALVFVGVGMSIISGAITMSHLVAAGLLAGAGFAFLGPTRSAYVLELVDGAHRGTAIALNQVALNASRVAGPAIAGALLAIDSVGSGGSYLTMAILYTLAVTTTIALPVGKPPPPPDSGILEDVIAGLRYVMGQPRLRTLLVFYILVIMTGFPFITVLPGFVENQLGHPAKQISVLMGTLAAGALMASLVIAPLADSTRALAIYTAAAFGFGVSLIITARMPSLTTTTAAMFLLGVASGTFQTLNGAMIVREADPAFMGRVMSLLMLAFAGFGLMALPVGVLADALGERNALTAMGVCVCSIVLVLSVALARTRSANSVLPPQAADSAANDRPVGP
jgi:MFS family permease